MTVEITEGFIRMPVLPHCAAPLCEQRCEPLVSLPLRFMGDGEAAREDHGPQVVQAQIVEEPPQDHEQGDVGAQRQVVQRLHKL